MFFVKIMDQKWLNDVDDNYKEIGPPGHKRAVAYMNLRKLVTAFTRSVQAEARPNSSMNGVEVDNMKYNPSQESVGK